MESQLTFILVDPRQESGVKLLDAYHPDLHPEHVLHVLSMHKALEAFLYAERGTFLISEFIPLEEQVEFIEDVLKAKNADQWSLVQLKDNFEPDFNLQELLQLGYHAALSLKYVAADRKQLQRLIQEQHRRAEAAGLKSNVSGTAALLLRELDKVAQYRKRGLQREFNTVGFDFVNEQSGMDAEYQEKYFEVLSEKTETAKPAPQKKIRVPKQVLRRRRLPKLSEDGYSGVSSRVFDKLLRRHGVDVNGPPPQTESAQEEATAPTEPKNDEPDEG